MDREQGFTLIELMLVMSIIGILAAIAIPNFIVYRDKSILSEGYALLGPVREDICEFYDYRGVFPKNNMEAGQPPPDAIKGKYVESITVEDGKITVLFNQESQSASGGTIVLIPHVTIDNPTGPVVWEEELNFKWGNS